MAQEVTDRETELLKRVKQRAYAIMHKNLEKDFELSEHVIAAALDPKNDVMGAVLDVTKNDLFQI